MEIKISEIIIYVLKSMEQEIRPTALESEYRLRKLLNRMISEGYINE